MKVIYKDGGEQCPSIAENVSVMGDVISRQDGAHNAHVLPRSVGASCSDKRESV